MIALVDTLTGGGVECDVQHAAIGSEGGVARPPVGDEHGIAADERIERGLEGRSLKDGQDVIAGCQAMLRIRSSDRYGPRSYAFC